MFIIFYFIIISKVSLFLVVLGHRSCADSLVAVSGAAVQLCCTGFSWWLLLCWSPGSRAFWLQLLQCMGLVAPWHVRPFWTRDWNLVTCIGRQIIEPFEFFIPYLPLLLLLLLSCFSRVRLCATPQTAAHQAPPSLGFSRQEHWSGLPFPSPIHESEKWKWSRLVVSDSWRPHRQQPTRLRHPWDSPGRSTRVGCHRLLQVILNQVCSL